MKSLYTVGTYITCKPQITKTIDKISGGQIYEVVITDQLTCHFMTSSYPI